LTEIYLPFEVPTLMLMTRSRYWGEHRLVRLHYSQLRRWTDGQLRNASMHPDGVIAPATTAAPAPPPPPCPGGYFVSGAGVASAEGCYRPGGSVGAAAEHLPPEGAFTKDPMHVLYPEGGVWRLGHPGHPPLLYHLRDVMMATGRRLRDWLRFTYVPENWPA
jgi:hypothetical protein